MGVEQHVSVDYPVVKSATALGGAGIAKYMASIGITSWGDAAAAMAFAYSAVLFLEWWWRKAIRPCLERRGWIKRRFRRREDKNSTGD